MVDDVLEAEISATHDRATLDALMRRAGVIGCTEACYEQSHAILKSYLDAIIDIALINQSIKSCSAPNTRCLLPEEPHRDLTEKEILARKQCYFVARNDLGWYCITQQGTTPIYVAPKYPIVRVLPNISVLLVYDS